MKLFFDTETTGLVKDWNNPSSSSNPDLVQLGFTVCDDNGRSIFTFGSLVIPYYDRDIDEGAFKAHGISKEMASEFGHDYAYVESVLDHWINKCDTIVAHNLKFDKCVIQKAFCNIRLENKKEYCTMLQSTNICKIVSNRSTYKWPKLEEAYMHFFGEKLIGAHDALTDVMACKRIYFEGLNNQQSKIPQSPKFIDTDSRLQHVVD